MGRKTIKLYCSQCKQYTNHKALKEIEEEYQDSQSHGPIWCKFVWQILQCEGCEYTSFRKVILDSDCIDGEGKPIEQETLYPERGEDKLSVKDIPGVSFELDSLYTETIKAYNSKMHLLCAAGLRAIIEGICLEKNVRNGLITKIDKSGNEETKRSKDLQGKIAGLAEKGFLTEKHAESLNELRFLGNEALHELERLSVEELKLAIEIVEHTIENIFALKQKTEDLRRTKSKRLIK